MAVPADLVQSPAAKGSLDGLYFIPTMTIKLPTETLEPKALVTLVVLLPAAPPACPETAAIAIITP